jgi:hypothetical protein
MSVAYASNFFLLLENTASQERKQKNKRLGYRPLSLSTETGRSEAAAVCGTRRGHTQEVEEKMFNIDEFRRK